MKTCFCCKESKELFDFYKHSQMKDGHLNKCIVCVKSYSNKHRYENLDKVQEYDRMRGSLPHRLEANKLRQKTEKGSKAHYEANKRYKEKYKNRAAARHIFTNAIRDKKIFKQPCLVCGELNVEGHHPDYDRPLDVVWLCISHHKQIHKEANAIFREFRLVYEPKADAANGEFHIG